MQPVISVSQLVDILNQTFEATLPPVEVEGEISGYRLWNQRLFFFDLKDESSSVNCMLPKGRAQIPLEDGMKVRIIANPKVTRKGRLSINVLRIEPVGEGSISRAFELLKKQLDKEGLFAPERKRELPELPVHIGVVTSLESAAYQDFAKILSSRMGGLEVTAVDTRVQGHEAVSQIVAAIDYFNQMPEPPEILVLTRGGGGQEDLAAFNTEPVARAVAGSRTPIVTAVGHETDTTLVDLVADVRAATPTDAARIIVPDKQELLAGIRRHQERMTMLIRNRLESDREEAIHKEGELLESSSEYLNGLDRHLKALRRTLTSFDPQAVMRRGYALVRRDQELIKSIGQVSVGETLVIQLAEGSIISEVTDVEEA